jgi:cell division protein FtsB
MKWLIGFLILILVLLQYQLWLKPDGIIGTWRLQKAVSKQTEVNAQLKEKNVSLDMAVNELKNGQTTIEEHARRDLGMIKKDETFYRFVPKDHANP